MTDVFLIILSIVVALVIVLQIISLLRKPKVVMLAELLLRLDAVEQTSRATLQAVTKNEGALDGLAQQMRGFTQATAGSLESVRNAVDEKLAQTVAESRQGRAQTCAQYSQEITQPDISPQRKANLGELAVQETINQFALQQPPQTAVFLFEDHRIARVSFFLPESCQKISTRAFLMFLEQKGWIASASAIERQAIQAGRMFSQLHFPAT